jgi:hypothetical protein
MARQSKQLPTRKLRHDGSTDAESLLRRSAESLGRVIGALQRQLDGATKRLSYPDDEGAVSPKAPARTRIARKSTATKRTRAAATKRNPAKKR